MIRLSIVSTYSLADTGSTPLLGRTATQSPCWCFTKTGSVGAGKVTHITVADLVCHDFDRVAAVFQKTKSQLHAFIADKFGASLVVLLFEQLVQSAFGQSHPIGQGRDGQRGVQGAANLIQKILVGLLFPCLLYTSPSPRDRTRSRMPSSA